ncbi:MAG TPA: hypothetical protein VJ761_17645 [Ktedonobacteraceae bacterium]|nr:hypothetical protein [Ktedonobacteraceae bacterium]
MGTKIQPLWEVREIYYGTQVFRYGFHVDTEQEARALYEQAHRCYPDSILEAERVDGILTKNARYRSWLQWRKYLNRVALLIGVLGAGLSIFPSITWDIQIAGVALNVFAIITFVALVYPLFAGLYKGPNQQEYMRVATLTIHHGKLSAPPIQRSDPSKLCYS